MTRPSATLMSPEQLASLQVEVDPNDLAWPSPHRILSSRSSITGDRNPRPCGTGADNNNSKVGADKKPACSCGGEGLSQVDSNLVGDFAVPTRPTHSGTCYCLACKSALCDWYTVPCSSDGPFAHSCWPPSWLAGHCGEGKKICQENGEWACCGT